MRASVPKIGCACKQPSFPSDGHGGGEVVNGNLDGLPYGWDDKALKKIHHNIIANLPAETSATLLESFRSSLPRTVLAGDLGERPQRTKLPAASRATRRSQILSAMEDAFSTWDPEAPSTSSIIPATLPRKALVRDLRQPPEFLTGRACVLTRLPSAAFPYNSRVRRMVKR
jgi:hypothetical protein